MMEAQEEQAMTGEVAETLQMINGAGLSKTAVERTEALLIERARSGDHAAFEQLMVCHQRKVIAMAWRMLGNEDDARDAAQEAFIKVYKYLSSYKPDQDFGGWLYRIVVNVCHDHGRKRRQYDRHLSFEDERAARHLDRVASDENIEAAAIQSQQRALIEAALKTLSKKERAALVLRDLEGLPTEEVAQILGSTQATVRSQIATARAKIKQFRDRALRQKSRG
jgi:RNA polymerase sigma-70 factor (ECF subfamily)